MTINEQHAQCIYMYYYIVSTIFQNNNDCYEGHIKYTTLNNCYSMISMN